MILRDLEGRQREILRCAQEWVGIGAIAAKRNLEVKWWEILKQVQDIKKEAENSSLLLVLLLF